MSLIHFFTLGYNPKYLLIGIIVGIVIGIYSFFRLKYLFDYYGLSKRNSLILRIIIFILIVLSTFNIQSLVTILIAYLFMASLFVDIICIIYKLIFKKGIKFHKNGLLAIVLFLLIVGYSVYGINTVTQTDYNITTDKTNESYTILYISDIHYATIQNPQILKDKISVMNSVNPDLIILGGDITDEGTSKEDMKDVYNELSKLNSTYGTFFIYGNHDEQPNVNDYRNGTKTYSNTELINTIEDSGIVILKDSKITINNDLLLIGRNDAGHISNNYRLNTSDLLNDSDLSKFVIVLDHQPTEELNNSKLGCDLQISGHTHGGQIFPFAIVKSLMGESCYGAYQWGSMKEIVSSGFAGWGVPIRNENPCEYVVININKN